MNRLFLQGFAAIAVSLFLLIGPFGVTAEEAIPSCSPPLAGDWIIETDCKLLPGEYEVPAGMTIRNNATLIIPEGAEVLIDIVNASFNIGSGSNLILEQGGRMLANKSNVVKDTLDPSVESDFAILLSLLEAEKTNSLHPKILQATKDALYPKTTLTLPDLDAFLSSESNRGVTWETEETITSIVEYGDAPGAHMKKLIQRPAWVLPAIETSSFIVQTSMIPGSLEESWMRAGNTGFSINWERTNTQEAHLRFVNYESNTHGMSLPLGTIYAEDIVHLVFQEYLLADGSPRWEVALAVERNGAIVSQHYYESTNEFSGIVEDSNETLYLKMGSYGDTEEPKSPYSGHAVLGVTLFTTNNPSYGKLFSTFGSLDFSLGTEGAPQASDFPVGTPVSIISATQNLLSSIKDLSPREQLGIRRILIMRFLGVTDNALFDANKPIRLLERDAIGSSFSTYSAPSFNQPGSREDYYLEFITSIVFDPHDDNSSEHLWASAAAADVVDKAPGDGIGWALGKTHAGPRMFTWENFNLKTWDGFSPSDVVVGTGEDEKTYVSWWNQEAKTLRIRFLVDQAFDSANHGWHGTLVLESEEGTLSIQDVFYPMKPGESYNYPDAIQFGFTNPGDIDLLPGMVIQTTSNWVAK